jgi:hypothetical protein
MPEFTPWKQSLATCSFGTTALRAPSNVSASRCAVSRLLRIRPRRLRSPWRVRSRPFDRDVVLPPHTAPSIRMMAVKRGLQESVATAVTVHAESRSRDPAPPVRRAASASDAISARALVPSRRLAARSPVRASAMRADAPLTVHHRLKRACTSRAGHSPIVMPRASASWRPEAPCADDRQWPARRRSMRTSVARGAQPSASPHRHESVAAATIVRPRPRDRAFCLCHPLASSHAAQVRGGERRRRQPVPHEQRAESTHRAHVSSTRGPYLHRDRDAKTTRPDVAKLLQSLARVMGPCRRPWRPPPTSKLATAPGVTREPPRPPPSFVARCRCHKPAQVRRPTRD